MYKQGESGNPAGRPKGSKNKAKFINVAEELARVSPNFNLVHYTLDILLGNNLDLDSKSCRMQALRILVDKAAMTPKLDDNNVTIPAETLLDLAQKCIDDA